jgi:hypothetical protein
VPTRDKTDSKTNGRSTEPPRRSRRTAALMVAATTAVLLSASVLWYRTHSGAIADDAVAQPSRTSPLTLDPAAFAGHFRPDRDAGASATGYPQEGVEEAVIRQCVSS